LESGGDLAADFSESVLIVVELADEDRRDDFDDVLLT